MHLSTLCLLPLAFPLVAQERSDYLGSPIHYELERSADPVSHLERKLEAQETQLEWHDTRGWLPALLEAFAIETSSQVLVFSKTSFQSKRISPTTPRAIYFGDDLYLAWIPGAPLMEITAIDPVQGPTFYTVDQRRGQPLQFVRRDTECLSCHASSRTRQWPGNLVRSVHPDESGQPILRSGTHLTTGASPFEERWGGWYVTGTHGEMRHMGNAVVHEGDAAERVDVEAGANLTDLSDHIDTQRYPSPHSDVVALMVMEHQAEMQNVLARASYQSRLAQAYQDEMNELLGRPAGTISDSTQRRITRAAQEVVDHLLLRGEARLEAKVRGTSDFAAEFGSRGTRDSKGRSLRDLDLETRLFRHRCSYLIDSEAFRALPEPVLAAVWKELADVVVSRPGTREFSDLESAERRALGEIVQETVPGVPEGWPWRGQD